MSGSKPLANWASGGILNLLNYTTATGAHKTLGTYAEQRFVWSAVDGTPIETAFKMVADGETALLEQVFPAGLVQKNNSSQPPKGVHLGFPAFESGRKEADLGALTWLSAFSQGLISHDATDAFFEKGFVKLYRRAQAVMDLTSRRGLSNYN